MWTSLNIYSNIYIYIFLSYVHETYDLPEDLFAQYVCIGLGEERKGLLHLIANLYQNYQPNTSDRSRNKFCHR